MNRTKIKSEKDSDHEESLFNSNRQNVLGEGGDQPRRSRRIRDLYGDSDNESEDNSSKNGRDRKGKDLEPDSDEEDDTFAIAWGAFGLADSEDENHEVTETTVIDSDEEFRDDLKNLDSLFAYDQDAQGLPLVSCSSSDDDYDDDTQQGDLFYATRNEKFNVNTYIKELKQSFDPTDPKCATKTKEMDGKLKNDLAEHEVAKDLKTDEEEEEFLFFITELGQAMGAMTMRCHEMINEMNEEILKSQLLLERSDLYLKRNSKGLKRERYEE